MRLEDYNEKDGKRVWLSSDELDAFIDQAEHPTQRVAFMLGGRGGLRRSEITSVTTNDFQHGPDGFVRVWSDYAKREKYREAPIPDELEHIVTTLTHDRDPDKPVVDVADSTVYRWVRKAADKLQAETGDRGWQFLDVHDLRRSWGGHLLWNCGVYPPVVREFGGWEDWETFEEHYMGQMTPEARDRERQKIDYVGGDPEPDEILFEPGSKSAKQVYNAK